MYFKTCCNVNLLAKANQIIDKFKVCLKKKIWFFSKPELISWADQQIKKQSITPATLFSIVMIFIGGRNLALSVLYNIVPPVGLLLFTSKSILPNRKI